MPSFRLKNRNYYQLISPAIHATSFDTGRHQHSIHLTTMPRFLPSTIIPSAAPDFPYREKPECIDCGHDLRGRGHALEQLVAPVTSSAAHGPSRTIALSKLHSRSRRVRKSRSATTWLIACAHAANARSSAVERPGGRDDGPPHCLPPCCHGRGARRPPDRPRPPRHRF